MSGAAGTSLRNALPAFPRAHGLTGTFAVLETVGSEAGPKASAAARKELVEKGVLLSSKKGVLLTAAAEGAINDLGHDEVSCLLGESHWTT